MSEMVIESSVREAGKDPIFRVAGMAAQRAAEVGKDAIINSTIGALMDDNGELICFDTVYNTLKSLPNNEIANYAPMPGTPEFREKAIEACFKSHKPEGYIRAVATPGGTGAIRHSFANYTEYGDKILVPNLYWAPYKTIARENRRDVQEFEMFDESGAFNIPEYERNFSELLEKQGRVLSVMNTPAHNPTGYSVSDDEWKELIQFYTKEANENPDKRIIIVCDVAYIDFAGQDEDARSFMELLVNMPHNVLVLYAFSASKSFTMYGLRNGALICVAPTEEVAAEFEASCIFSTRGTWSNGTRGAMQTLATIFSDEELYNDFLKEQKKYRSILQERAKAFLTNAEKIGLKICDYHDGFFLSIPCENPTAVSDKLMEKDFFIVALKKGLRFAPCAVSIEKCAKAPQMILEAIEEVNGK